jgi:hypothetical protein
MVRKLIHRHTVDAGTALVLSYPPQCGLKVWAADHLLHQVARSRTLVPMDRRRLFLAPLYLRGFTPALKRQLQLPGHLRPFAFEAHARFVLSSVRSFALNNTRLL